MATVPEETETVNPETTRSLAALGEIRIHFEDDTLNFEIVENDGLVATVALLLVPTAGPCAPRLSMAVDMLESCVERPVNPFVTEVWSVFMEEETVSTEEEMLESDV